MEFPLHSIYLPICPFKYQQKNTALWIPILSPGLAWAHAANFTWWPAVFDGPMGPAHGKSGRFHWAQVRAHMDKSSKSQQKIYEHVGFWAPQLTLNIARIHIQQWSGGHSSLTLLEDGAHDHQKPHSSKASFLEKQENRVNPRHLACRSFMSTKSTVLTVFQ